MRSPLSPLAALTLILAPGLAHADTASPYGINTYQPSAAELDKVAEAGIGWVRVDFNWFQMEPARDSYQWALTDRIVADARARGLEVFATLAYTPGWANGGQGIGAPPTDLADWVDFVGDTVSRYRGQVKHWGMWNEPNLGQFFTGDVDTYVSDILRPGAFAAKAADPTCYVLGPDLAHLESGEWRRWLYTVLEDGGDSLDIITHHIYKGSGAEAIRTLGVWVPFWDRPMVTGIIEMTGQSGKPLWLTETGWHTDEVSEDAQARYLVQTLDGVMEHSWLDKVFFYELRDDPNIPEAWGILRADLSPKAAFGALLEYIATH